MVLVLLEVNGNIKWVERDTLAEAKDEAAKWLEETNKAFPHKEFTPIFFKGRRLE